MELTECSLVRRCVRCLLLLCIGLNVNLCGRGHRSYRSFYTANDDGGRLIAKVETQLGSDTSGLDRSILEKVETLFYLSSNEAPIR